MSLPNASTMDWIIFASVGLFAWWLIVALVRWSRGQRAAFQQTIESLGWAELKSGITYNDQLDGVDYEYEYHQGGKHDPSYFRIQVKCQSSGMFKLNHEGKLDRFFKRGGFSVELQTGDKDFDDFFYIQSEHLDFARSYFGNSRRREAIQKLFALGFTSLEHDGEMLEVRCHLGNLKNFGDLPSALIPLITASQEMPQHLGAVPMLGTSAPKAKRGWLNAVCFVFFMLPLCGFIAALKYFPPLDESKMVLSSLTYGVPATLLTLTLLVMFHRGRSTSHKEFYSTGITALIAVPATTASLLCALNGYWDSGTATVHRAQVERKTESSKGPSYLYVSSWRNAYATERIGVHKDTKNRARAGASILAVTTKPGHFNFEWVVEYHLE